MHPSVALFTIAKTWKQSKCPSTDEWIKTCTYIHIHTYTKWNIIQTFSSVQFSCSVVSDSLQLHGLQHTRPHCPSPTNSWHLLKLISTESVMPSNHLILCHPLLLLPSIFPSIRVFSNESVLCIRWPKYLEFQVQHQSFQGIFRTDFL